MVTAEQVRKALTRVMDPELNRSLVELGMVHEVRVQGEQVTLTLALTVAGCPLREQIAAEARAAVLALDGVKVVEVKLTEMTAEEKRRIGLGEAEQSGTAERFNRIRRVVAVMSGKGGVGKSLLAALLTAW